MIKQIFDVLLIYKRNYKIEITYINSRVYSYIIMLLPFNNKREREN